MTNIENNLIPFPKVSIVDSEKLFDIEFEIYNEKQDLLRDKLRYTHKSLFAYLLKALNYELSKNTQIFKEKFQIDPSEEYGIHTNRSRLGDFMKCANTTIGNLLDRLVQAGFIRKISHGPVRDFEIFINPKLLKIYDCRAEFLKIKNSGIATTSEGQIKSLNMFWLNKQEPFNKIINTVDKVSNFSSNATAFGSKCDENVQPSGMHTGTNLTGTQGDFSVLVGKQKTAAETNYLSRLEKQEQKLQHTRIL